MPTEDEQRRAMEEHDLATFGTPEERQRAVAENVREISEARLREARRRDEYAFNEPGERIARALEALLIEQRRIADALERTLIVGYPVERRGL